MKKTKKRLTRLLAICVCLIVVLSACASVDVPSDNSTSTEESKATSALELSEVNAESTSSEAEPSAPEGHISADDDATLSGDITITPIEPILPEERETTLEKVLSFDIGIDGVVQYNFTFYDDPSGATMTNIGRIFTDGNGIFYYKSCQRDLKKNFIKKRRAGIINLNIKLYRVGLNDLPLFFCKEKQRKSNLLVQLTLSMVPKAGLEPACCCQQRILSPPRLPFHHFGNFCLIILAQYRFCGQAFLLKFLKTF